MSDIGNWFKYLHFCTCKSWLERGRAEYCFGCIIMYLMTDQVKPGHLRLSWRGLSETKTCFYPVAFVFPSWLNCKVRNCLMRILRKLIECSVTYFQFICFMVVLRIFLFYIWAQIETDYSLISCDIFIFRPWLTSSGHFLLKTRDFPVLF